MMGIVSEPFYRDYEGRKEMFFSKLRPRHIFIYGYNYSVGLMVKDHLYSEKGNPLPPAMVLLYAPFHRQDSTYHGLCYTSRGALSGSRNSSMGPP